jgi:hypothetical protein
MQAQNNGPEQDDGPDDDEIVSPTGNCCKNLLQMAMTLYCNSLAIRCNRVRLTWLARHKALAPLRFRFNWLGQISCAFPAAETTSRRGDLNVDPQFHGLSRR